jgi:hypothetical protein
MPKGKKQCPTCNALLSVRALLCTCGFTFEKSKSKKKAPKPFFSERKDFIKRMLDGGKSKDIALDMITATKVFEAFDNNIDFLAKVKPPFKLDGSIRYFLTADGKEFLRKKKLEFDYKPKNAEKIVDHFQKTGEDIMTNKHRTLRDFLNDE